MADTVIAITCLPAELLPRFCFALPVSDLAALAAAACVGRNAVDALPIAFWKSYLRRCVGLHVDGDICASGAVACDAAPVQSSFDRRMLRRELQFWLKSAHTLPLPVSGDEWLFHDQASLVAARGMAEDARELLQGHGSQGTYPWSAHRLTFSFAEAKLAEIREALERASVLQSFDIQWECDATGVFVNNVFVPCRLSLKRHSSVEKPAWEAYFELSLSRSGLPIYFRGVQKALVVYLFSSGPNHRVCAPRCVSFMGMDGQVSLLTACASDVSPLETDAGKVLNSCGWMEGLLNHGKLPAIALVEHVSYMM
mmetsp:Transcript_92047/g.177452  ORF Transcript_92047/g.177452 Transcript_92047/m.177452 type:complete len:311 (-) Transcript_92047:248-1180(-)